MLMIIRGDGKGRKERCEEGLRERRKRSGGIIKVILFFKTCDQISNYNVRKLVKVIMVICCTTPVLHITYIVTGVASGKLVLNALEFTPANVIW